MMGTQKQPTKEQRRARRKVQEPRPALPAPVLNFVTYVEPDRVRFVVVVATGPGTKPTPDGGPWAVEYTVPEHERHRLAECSASAEGMLWRMLSAHASAVFDEAKARGWVDRTPKEMTK